MLKLYYFAFCLILSSRALASISHKPEPEPPKHKAPQLVHRKLNAKSLHTSLGVQFKSIVTQAFQPHLGLNLQVHLNSFWDIKFSLFAQDPFNVLAWGGGITAPIRLANNLRLETGVGFHSQESLPYIPIELEYFLSTKHSQYGLVLGMQYQIRQKMNLLFGINFNYGL